MVSQGARESRFAAAPRRLECRHARSHDQVRAERSGEHRVPGGRRGRVRHRLHPGGGLARRSDLGRSCEGAVLPEIVVGRSLDRVRQTRDRRLGPGGGRGSGDAYRRCAGGDGRGGLTSRGAGRRLRRRPDEPPVCGDAPGPCRSADDLRVSAPLYLGARLPVGAPAGRARAGCGGRSASLGHDRAGSRVASGRDRGRGHRGRSAEASQCKPEQLSENEPDELEPSTYVISFRRSLCPHSSCTAAATSFHRRRALDGTTDSGCNLRRAPGERASLVPRGLGVGRRFDRIVLPRGLGPRRLGGA